MSIYVFDTNVFIGNGNIFEKLKDATLIIPFIVLAELDKHKDLYHVRQTLRHLESLRLKGSLFEGVLDENNLTVLIAKSNPELIPDDAIIDVAAKTPEAILISNDINVRVKADVLQVKAYSDDILFPDRSLEEIQISQTMLPSDAVGENCFLLVKGEDKSTLYRKHKEGLFEVQEQTAFALEPKNLEQDCAIDLLLDVQVPLVCLAGKAGTGKTLLSLAAGLEMILKKKVYQNLMVIRPIVPVGNDLGFLPGTLEEKMQVWSLPIFDLLDQILDQRHFSTEYLIESGILEVLPPSHLRGRTLSDTFVIVDEAQNLSRHEMKTIVTRLGENSKVVLTGDIQQIDAGKMSEHDNGFSYLMGKFRGHSLAGIMRLLKSERSDLAAIAAEIL